MYRQYTDRFQAVFAIRHLKQILVAASSSKAQVNGTLRFDHRRKPGGPLRLVAALRSLSDRRFGDFRSRTSLAQFCGDCQSLLKVHGNLELLCVRNRLRWAQLIAKVKEHTEVEVCRRWLVAVQPTVAPGRTTSCILIETCIVHQRKFLDPYVVECISRTSCKASKTSVEWEARFKCDNEVILFTVAQSGYFMSDKSLKTNISGIEFVKR